MKNQAIGSINLNNFILPPDDNPRKRDAHVQLSKRFAKGMKIMNTVTFTTPTSAWVPSSDGENLHHVTFGDKQYCDDCYSYTQGYSSDPNFECYHIIATRLKAKLVFT